ncbi:MAG: hypothetical protein IPM34_13370 [Saprospiraceae bacterium]|nr:hypothetical protein [Saprospiraceae bacterium]
MKSPFVLELYNTLNAKQRQRFIEFLKSPYFNTNKKLIEGLLALQSLILKKTDLIKPELFHALYPGENYADIKLRLFFSELLNQLKTFIFIESKHKSEIEKNLLLLKHLRKNQKIREFEREASKLQETIDSGDHWDPQRYEWKHQLDMEILSYESFRNRFTHFDFGLCAEHLEVSALIQRLRIYLEQLSHESIGRKSSEYPMVDVWMQQAVVQNWAKYPELKLYLLAIQLFRNPEQETYFDEYLDLLKQHEKYFDFEYGRELYLTALNYGIRKINQNNTKYFRITLNLFQHCIENTWILDYGVMSSLTYKNIIVLCIRMNDLELAEQVLEKYKALVNVKDRNMIYQFCKAKIQKERGQYQQALYLLNTSIFKDPLIELNARVEMIKIYYELKESELMGNQIIATKNLIRRSKKLGYHRDYYINFLASAGKLNHTLKLPAKEKDKWLSEILNDKKLIEKTWLHSMVSKLN